jgi:hypothetical protein
MTEFREAKAVTAADLLAIMRLGIMRDYECQLPDTALRDLDPTHICIVRAQSIEPHAAGAVYRCAAHLDREQMTVDLSDDALTIGFGDAVLVDVPTAVYDSWHSVTEVLNLGTKVIQARPNFVQRFPERGNG